MAFRELLHHELGAALGLHHEDPVVQNLAGLRRVGAAVYGLEDELKAAETKPGSDLQRARCYFAAAATLVTFADAFVLDAFLDSDHPKHVPHVTYLQARQFYLLIPDLVTAVRKEIAYPESGGVHLPILCGPRIELPGRCPLEHLLAMRRAAEKVDEVVGTRIELLRGQAGDGAVKAAVLALAEAKTKKESADQVIGALRAGQHVPQEAHEQAEAYYYDGVLRVYLYAAQELELPGVTRKAPVTENDEDDPEEPAPTPLRAVPQARPAYGSGGFGYNSGPGLAGPGFGLGQLFAADMLANLVGDLLGGLFGGGGGGMWW